jgi:(2Fe-2S) ferredoxin
MADHAALTLTEVADKLKITSIRKHVFLCIGPECCDPEVGQATWEALKQELKDRRLSLTDHPHACYRTKAACLRVCRDGPIAVIYPEGTWHARLSAADIPDFVTNHIEGNSEGSDSIFVHHPLPSAPIPPLPSESR